MYSCNWWNMPANPSEVVTHEGHDWRWCDISFAGLQGEKDLQVIASNSHMHLGKGRAKYLECFATPLLLCFLTGFESLRLHRWQPWRRFGPSGAETECARHPHSAFEPPTMGASHCPLFVSCALPVPWVLQSFLLLIFLPCKLVILTKLIFSTSCPSGWGGYKYYIWLHWFGSEKCTWCIIDGHVWSDLCQLPASHGCWRCDWCSCPSDLAPRPMS